MEFNENELQNEETNEAEVNQIQDEDLEVSGGKVIKGEDGKYYPTIDAIGGFSTKKNATEVDRLINEAMPKPGPQTPTMRPRRRPQFKVKPGGRKK